MKKERLWKRIWLLAGALVMMVALVELVATWLLAGPPAKKESWKKASKLVTSQFKEGDLLLFAPRWLGPTGRFHLGDLLDLRQMSRPDEADFKRLWVVGLAGKRRRETRGTRLISRKTIGNLQVSLFENKSDPPLFDFYEHLADARVQLLKKNGSINQQCPYDARRHRHQCRAGWNNVRQKLAEVDYQLRRCIYAHPVDGKTLEIRFPQAILGSRLVIYTGLDGYDSRLKARRAVYFSQNPHKMKKGQKPNPNAAKKLADVSLRVKSGQKQLGVVRHPIDDRWRRHVLDTTQMASTKGPVVFQISTKWAYSKAFCFYAQSRK